MTCDWYWPKWPLAVYLFRRSWFSSVSECLRERSNWMQTVSNWMPWWIWIYNILVSLTYWRCFDALSAPCWLHAYCRMYLSFSLNWYKQHFESSPNNVPLSQSEWIFHYWNYRNLKEKFLYILRISYFTKLKFRDPEKSRSLCELLCRAIALLSAYNQHQPNHFPRRKFIA